MKETLIGFACGFVANILFNILWDLYQQKLGISLNKTLVGLGFFVVSTTIFFFVFRKHILPSKK